jgi:hypothetical protein
VAIKIIKKAHDSTDDLDKDPEIQAMRDLEKYYIKGSQDRPRGFIQLFDWFRHEGPNGIHNCLVMELLGPSLETALRTNIMMEDFWHRIQYVGHRGSCLKPSNLSIRPDLFMVV